MIITTLRKKSAKVLHNDFANDTPSIKYLGEGKFIFNNASKVEAYDKISIILGESISLVIDNFDIINLKPRKYYLSNTQTFICKNLALFLNCKINNVYSLEPLYFENENTFIGYSITNNNQLETINE